MGICNRTLDASEQKRTFTSSYGLIGTGVTMLALTVPSNGTLLAAKLAANGLSGAPTYDLRINRFIVGAGVTVINPGSTTLTATAHGTSGVQSFLVGAAASSLVQVLANDVLTITTGGANTAASFISLGFVIQAVQDIKTQYGV